MEQTFTIPPALSNQTLAAALRTLLPNLSWSHAKRLITSRRIQVNGVLTLNDARRLSVGEAITILPESAQPVPTEHSVRLLHMDADLLVLDKPAGVITLRRDEEFRFSQDRKDLQPSLDELVQRMLPTAAASNARAAHARPRRASSRARRKDIPLYAVHRLDRDTSGLMLFALTPRARNALIDLFSRHAVERSYVAVARGAIPAAMTLDTHFVRDRGDGLRGSVALPRDDSKRAVTQFTPLEHFADAAGNAYTLLHCRLETGRTHQIRIHLAEIGHPLCGEKLYRLPRPGAPEEPDPSAAPRQALHTATHRLTHPFTRQPLEFTSPLPPDLSSWLEKLRPPRAAS